MTRLLPILALGLPACGSLAPAHVHHGVDPGATPDVITGPSDDREEWDFQTPPGWDPYVEAWRVDVRSTSIPGIDDALWESLSSELAFEVLGEDAPQLRIRTAAVIAGSDPPAQDNCFAAANPEDTTSDGVGGIELVLGPEEADFGQPWTWDSLVVVAHKDVELQEVDVEQVTGIAPATDVANAVWGAGDCTDFHALGLECGPCAMLQGDCVVLPLQADAAYIGEFAIEPLSKHDVSVNPDCD